MAKRLLIVCVVAVLCLPGLAWAGKTQKNPVAAEGKVFTGRAEYQNIRTFLDFVVDAMDGLGLKYQDARISPIVISERWYEFPIELGWMGTQDTLVPLLEKLFSYSFADSRIAHGSVTVSCSAETRDDGEVILTISTQEKLLCPRVAEKLFDGKPIDFWEGMSKRNQQIIRAFRSLLKVTTFTPQVRKKILGGGVGPGKTWLTNLRIDSDYRVQFTGYGLDARQVTQLGENLLMSGSFVELFISNMNKNTFEKVPVWRFDFSGKVN